VRKYKILIYFFLILIQTTYSYSQNIAYANLDLIIQNSEVGKKIISYFSDKNEKMINEFKANEKIIRDKEKSLISQKNVIEPDEYIKKIEIIKKEIQEFNNKSKKQLRELNQEKETVSKSFLIEVNKILKEYAEKNKIDIIFSSKQMLIGKSSLDLTENILKSVNKKIKNFEITND
tara:strand:- start:451 stop:978 length:528 start_codon:yes stop_codon:yes gene_type:complete